MFAAPNDPTATLAVHCGNGFDAGFSPYQSTRLSRYNAGPEPGCGYMRRREFISFLGVLIEWLRGSRMATRDGSATAGDAGGRVPQQPITGRLYGPYQQFRQGLKEAGYVEGMNVAIEYRWAEDHNDRLPALAADLVHRKVAVIVSPVGAPAALAAKAATNAIPIVFAVNQDPVALGLVASLARPGGNATGVNYFTGELVAKRLELLHQLVPTAVRVGVLVNPDNAGNTQTTLRDVETAARAIGLQIQVLKASSVGEIDAAFASLARARADAVFVGGDTFFNSRRLQFALLAARHGLPASYTNATTR